MALEQNIEREQSEALPQGSAAGVERASVPATGESGQVVHESQKKRTFGNKMFDFIVYPAIAWVGVSALSVYMAHETSPNSGNNSFIFKKIRELNKSVLAMFEKSVESGLLKNIIKDKSPENIERWSEGLSMYGLLALGGTMLMWPIKALEDNRKKLAAKLDSMFGTTPQNQAEVAKEPKQSWFSVLSGRVLSVGIGFSAFLAMGPKNAGNWSKACGAYFTDKWMKVFKNHNEANVKSWMDVAAFDVIFTTITASVTYAFSRFIAKRNDKAQDVGESMMTFDPATPTPTAPLNFDSAEQNVPATDAPQKTFVERTAKQNTEKKIEPKSFKEMASKREQEAAVGA